MKAARSVPVVVQSKSPVIAFGFLVLLLGPCQCRLLADEDPAVQKALEDLKSSASSARQAAVRQIYGDQDVLKRNEQKIIGYLKDEDEDVVLAALQVLATLKDGSDSLLVEVATVLKTRKPNKSATVLGVGILASRVASHKQARTELVELLRDSKDTFTRRSAAVGLAKDKYEDPEVVQSLRVSLKNDKEIEVRGAAAAVLGHLRTNAKECVPEIIKELKAAPKMPAEARRRGSVDPRQFMLQGLAQFGEQALPSLSLAITISGDSAEDTEVREAAVTVLAAIGKPAGDALFNLRFDPEIGMPARKALSKLEGKKR